MRKFFERVMRENVGATAIEYGLIAAAIAVVLISTLFLIGGNMRNALTMITKAL